MISPLVRRKRLARELRHYRDKAGLSSSQLAARARLNRQKISSLENGHPFTNVADVAAVLDALDLDESTWHMLFQIADDATKPGWWASWEGMGHRQILYVDLEAGASTVREYNNFVVPGLLQIADYVRTRAQLSALHWQWGDKGQYDIERGIAARAQRQKMTLRRPDGPNYQAILDELVIRRAAASPEVMVRQLEHLVEMSELKKVQIRVLPIEASMGDLWVPRSPFSLYSYPDSGDPTVAVVDTEVEDYLYIDDAEVRPYIELFDRLEKGALSVEESAEFLRDRVKYFAKVSEREKSEPR